MGFKTMLANWILHGEFAEYESIGFVGEYPYSGEALRKNLNPKQIREVEEYLRKHGGCETDAIKRLYTFYWIDKNNVLSNMMEILKG